MSKVIVFSTKNGKKFAVKVVPQKAKTVYSTIKRDLPGVSVGVYGARDLATLKRSQRTLKPENISDSVPELVSKVKKSGNYVRTKREFV